MEYKYLLELLRSGLYEEFFADFKKARYRSRTRRLTEEVFTKIPRL